MVLEVLMGLFSLVIGYLCFVMRRLWNYGLGRIRLASGLPLLFGLEICSLSLEWVG